jgi:hypothetical protein
MYINLNNTEGCVGTLRKTTKKSSKVIRVPTELRTENLPDTSCSQSEDITSEEYHWSQVPFTLADLGCDATRESQ